MTDVQALRKDGSWGEPLSCDWFAMGAIMIRGECYTGNVTHGNVMYMECDAQKCDTGEYGAWTILFLVTFLHLSLFNVCPIWHVANMMRGDLREFKAIWCMEQSDAFPTMTL